MHTPRSTPLCLCACLLAAATAQAAIPVSDSAAVYTQDFNTLPSDNGSDPDWLNNQTLPGWYLFAGPNLSASVGRLRVSTSSGSDRAHISYGANGDSDRALGSQAGSSHRYADTGSIPEGQPFGAIAVSFENSGQTPLEGFAFSYTGEQWHVSSNAGVGHALLLEWALGAPDAAFVDLDWQPFSGEQQAAPGVHFVSPVVAGGVTGNGQLPDNRVLGLGATVLGMQWLPGQRLWLRWVDLNDPASDHGLAINDFSFVAIAPEPVFEDGFEESPAGSP